MIAGRPEDDRGAFAISPRINREIGAVLSGRFGTGVAGENAAFAIHYARERDGEILQRRRGIFRRVQGDRPGVPNREFLHRHIAGRRPRDEIVIHRAAAAVKYGNVHIGSVKRAVKFRIRAAEACIQQLWTEQPPPVSQGRKIVGAAVRHLTGYGRLQHIQLQVAGAAGPAHGEVAGGGRSVSGLVKRVIHVLRLRREMRQFIVRRHHHCAVLCGGVLFL